ncbi:hypothetical protein ARMGADRAFT_1037979 [Armillaria gallica]|uniref:Uncharacterized protein n=1 Tax=Armillaria gallica TaxID=47427 RepID=A0A2H3CK21_ARMGA|nr:hypothetical protein ARMGADRAFT_1037979 [Armillaria gallica]
MTLLDQTCALCQPPVSCRPVRIGRLNGKATSRYKRERERVLFTATNKDPPLLAFLLLLCLSLATFWGHRQRCSHQRRDHYVKQCAYFVVQLAFLGQSNVASSRAPGGQNQVEPPQQCNTFIW